MLHAVEIQESGFSSASRNAIAEMETGGRRKNGAIRRLFRDTMSPAKVFVRHGLNSDAASISLTQLEYVRDESNIDGISIG